MESRNSDVCRFYMKGTCKNGDRCAFQHPTQEKAFTKKEPSRQQKKRQSQQKMEQEIKDPEALQKLEYLRNMKMSLRQPCKVCKSKKLLSIISCGCQVICRNCANNVKECPTHKTAFDSEFIIGGQED